jgi:hypothetical protein
MVAGSRSPSSSRQSGRYSEEKDRKSNRKPNRKTYKDRDELDEEARDTQRLERVLESSLPLGRPDGYEQHAVQPSGPIQNQPDNRDSTPPKSSGSAGHNKVLAERPEPKPSWFQKQEAFAPSRSYITKKKEDV